MKVKHYTAAGALGSLTLSGGIFAGQTNPVLLSQAIRVYLSNARQGTSKVKTRSEINRTKKKWFKQKGTGNARHGARTSNIFVGGGVVHGPTGEQNWKRSLPQTMKHQALRTALITQAERVIIHDGLAKLDGKTASAQQLLSKADVARYRVLVVVASASTEQIRSLRNLDNVLLTSASRVTALEVAVAERILMTAEAVEALNQRVSKTAASATQDQPASAVAEPTTRKAAPKKTTKTTTTRKKKAA